MRLATVLVAGLVPVSLALAISPARVISSGGVQLVVPTGWQRIAAASPGPVTDPRTLLVVGTAGVRSKPSQCQIAAYRLPPTAAVVVAVGWKKLALSGAESQRQGRWPLNKMVAVRRSTFECFEGRGAAATLVLGGKGYQVNVLVGDRASKQRIAEALTVARSFDLAR